VQRHRHFNGATSPATEKAPVEGFVLFRFFFFAVVWVFVLVVQMCMVLWVWSFVWFRVGAHRRVYSKIAEARKTSNSPLFPFPSLGVPGMRITREWDRRAFRGSYSIGEAALRIANTEIDETPPSFFFFFSEKHADCTKRTTLIKWLAIK